MICRFITLGAPPSPGLTPLAILPALGDLRVATALDTFLVSLLVLALALDMGVLAAGVLEMLSRNKKIEGQVDER